MIPPQELSLLDIKFLRFAPSETAAAAILLALGHQEVATQQRVRLAFRL